MAGGAGGPGPGQGGPLGGGGFDPFGVARTNQAVDAWRKQQRQDFEWGGDPQGANKRAGALSGYGSAGQQRQAPQADYGQAQADYGTSNQDYAQSQAMRGRESSQADYLQQVMQGKAGPSLAEMQMQRGTDQSIQAQMAMAHSAMGAGPQLAAAQAHAGQQAGLMQTQNVQQTGLLRAQEQMQARQEYEQYLAGIRQQDMQSRGIGIQQQAQSAEEAEFQARQKLQQEGLNDQYQLGMEGLSNQTQIAQLQAGGAYQGLQAQVAAQQQAQDNAMTSGWLGMGATALGAGAGFALGGPAGAAAGGYLGGHAASDERVKDDITPIDGASSAGSLVGEPSIGTGVTGGATAAGSSASAPEGLGAGTLGALLAGEAMKGASKGKEAGGDMSAWHSFDAFTHPHYDAENLRSDAYAKYDMTPLGPHGASAPGYRDTYEMTPSPGARPVPGPKPDLYEALVSDKRAKEDAHAVGYQQGLMAATAPLYANRYGNPEAHMNARQVEEARAKERAMAEERNRRYAAAEAARAREVGYPAAPPANGPPLIQMAPAGGYPPPPPPAAVASDERSKSSALMQGGGEPVQPYGYGQAFPRGVTSDERVKQEIRGAPEVNRFLEELHPYRFHYKPGVPGEDPGEEHFGIMAQDAERSRMGRSFVRQGPGGMKELDTRHGFGTLLAAQAAEHRRIDALEDGLQHLMRRGR